MNYDQIIYEATGVDMISAATDLFFVDKKRSQVLALLNENASVRIIVRARIRIQ